MVVTTLKNRLDENDKTVELLRRRLDRLEQQNVNESPASNNSSEKLPTVESPPVELQKKVEQVYNIMDKVLKKLESEKGMKDYKFQANSITHEFRAPIMYESFIHEVQSFFSQLAGMRKTKPVADPVVEQPVP